MSELKPAPDNIDRIVQEVLEMGGVSLEAWDELRSTPQRAEPMWPGDDAIFSNAAELAPYIDHTLLKPDAGDDEIERLCGEAIHYGFASVCVNSSHVKTCVELLQDSDVAVCGVVGFPLGAMATEIKYAEASFIIENGGTEIDMVINLGKLKGGDADYIAGEIDAVLDAADDNAVKVIIETGFLSREEIVFSSVLAVVAGAPFIKTSTGFGPGGATVGDVALIRRIVGPNVGVKASGGIRDMESAIKMIRAGANRIGTSHGVAIATGDLKLAERLAPE